MTMDTNSSRGDFRDFVLFIDVAYLPSELRNCRMDTDHLFAVIVFILQVTEF